MDNLLKGKLDDIFVNFSLIGKDIKFALVEYGDRVKIRLDPYLYDRASKSWKIPFTVTKEQCFTETIHWRAYAYSKGGRMRKIIDIKTIGTNISFELSW